MTFKFDTKLLGTRQGLVLRNTFWTPLVALFILPFIRMYVRQEESQIHIFGSLSTSPTHRQRFR